MSEDPKLFDTGDYNLFRYCHNDPIDNVDPMGLADERREPWYNHEEQAKQLAKLQTLLNQKLFLGYGAISVGGLQYALTQLQQTMGDTTNFHMAQIRIAGNAARPQLQSAKVQGAVGELRKALNDSDDETKMSYSVLRDKKGHPHEVKAASRYAGGRWIERAAHIPRSWVLDYNGHVHPLGHFTWSPEDILMSFEGVVAKNHDNRFDNRGGPRAFADVLYKGWEFRADGSGAIISW
jgi:hypothetical protein